MKYRVWYMKPEFFRDGIMGAKWLKERGMLPTMATLEKTHVLLREVEANGLDEIYYQQQGEVWSPNGEARGLIREKGLQHTSMSVGDVIVGPGGDAYGDRGWIVDSVGFTKLSIGERP